MVMIRHHPTAECSTGYDAEPNNHSLRILICPRLLECEIVEKRLVCAASQCTHVVINADTMLATSAPDTESLEAKLRIQRNFRGDLKFAKIQ